MQHRQKLLEGIRALACLSLMVAWVSLAVADDDGWDLAEAHGVLRVHGALSESACRLDMSSNYQYVLLGDVGTGQLQYAGDQGTPVVVRLSLRDCIRSASGNPDTRTSNLLWRASRPAVSISFRAPKDSDSPELVAVQGVSGLALRISDELRRDVPLGSRSSPMPITPGQNELTYIVTPERTKAPLQAGSYWAQVGFYLDYD